jgi:protein O-GlcNAc transferase
LISKRDSDIACHHEQFRTHFSPSCKAIPCQLPTVGQIMKKKRRSPIARPKGLPAIKPTHPNAAAQANIAKLQTALALHQQGLLDQAEALYKEILQSQPHHPDALHLLGVIAYQSGNLLQAVNLIGAAIAVNPNNAGACNNHGNALYGLKRLDEALASYDQAIRLDPGYAKAHNNRGNALYDLKRLDEALASYGQAIRLDPDSAEAYNNRGDALKNLKRLDEALASYDRAIQLDSGSAEAFNNRGNALLALKRLDEALASYDQAITLKPDYAEAINNRGNALLDLKRQGEALASFEQAIMIKPGYAEACNNRGNALYELQRQEEALASYEQAIVLKPDYAEAYYNRGNALLDLKRQGEALASYDQAIRLKPDYAKAYYNRGNALDELRRQDEALASFEQAITLDPGYTEAYNNRGNTLLDLKRREEALASYDRAITLKPDYAEAYSNRGNVLVKLNRYADAVQAYTRLVELEPEYIFAKGNLLHAKMLCCDWEGVDRLYQSVREDIRKRKKSAHPFGHQGIATSEQELRTCAELYAEEVYPAQNRPLCRRKIQRHPKIRLGYLSGEFRHQATSILMAELWELHDKDRFEIFAFDNGWDDGSVIRARINKAFHEVADITKLSDLEAAELINANEIDILVNLNGYFGDGRQGVFSYRPSPIQVNYLGFPGTIGAGYIDYLIADARVIPEGSRQYYSEKIAYLPNSYQANDRKRVIADQQFSREELGLPQTGFVFCCFNNTYKITPATFDGWMRILRSVEGSVLWLLGDDPTAAGNLRKEAEARGVSAERLIFSQRMPLPEHLARHRTADLFLDTLPYNAHTTASDALWAGLPVLTCAGQTFAGRVAASLLRAIGLPELITSTQEAYEALAIELATNPEVLGHIKHKLAANSLTTPLFDSKLFAGHIEDAYTQMYERYQADLPPDHLTV